MFVSHYVNGLSWPSYLLFEPFLTNIILNICWVKSHFSNSNHYTNRYWRFTNSFLLFWFHIKILLWYCYMSISY